MCNQDQATTEEARQFVNDYNRIGERKKHEQMVAEWEQATNTTSESAERLTNVTTELQQWGSEMATKVLMHEIV